ncbi:MAG: DUF1667 domain-containing protein [Candidatus Bathyarchaeia archaeon]
MSNATRTLTFTCIICPIGCRLKILVGDSAIISIEGNRCPRGAVYAQNEINPKRTLITVIKVKGGNLPVVSVKSSEPIPKSLIPKAMEALSEITVQAPIKIGDIIIQNLLDLGVNIVATRNVEEV